MLLVGYVICSWILIFFWSVGFCCIIKYYAIPCLQFSFHFSIKFQLTTKYNGIVKSNNSFNCLLWRSTMNEKFSKKSLSLFVNLMHLLLCNVVIIFEIMCFCILIHITPFCNTMRIGILLYLTTHLDLDLYLSFISPKKLHLHLKWSIFVCEVYQSQS